MAAKLALPEAKWLFHSSEERRRSALASRLPQGFVPQHEVLGVLVLSPWDFKHGSRGILG